MPLFAVLLPSADQHQQSGRWSLVLYGAASAVKPGKLIFSLTIVLTWARAVASSTQPPSPPRPSMMSSSSASASAASIAVVSNPLNCSRSARMQALLPRTSHSSAWASSSRSSACFGSRGSCRHSDRWWESPDIVVGRLRQGRNRHLEDPLVDWRRGWDVTFQDSAGSRAKYRSQRTRRRR